MNKFTLNRLKARAQISMKFDHHMTILSLPLKSWNKIYINIFFKKGNGLSKVRVMKPPKVSETSQLSANSLNYTKQAFRTLSNINDRGGFFCKNNHQLYFVIYYRQKAPSQIFDMLLNKYTSAQFVTYCGCN